VEFYDIQKFEMDYSKARDYIRQDFDSAVDECIKCFVMLEEYVKVTELCVLKQLPPHFEHIETAWRSVKERYECQRKDKLKRVITKELIGMLDEFKSNCQESKRRKLHSTDF
jgi:hypothetical protein